MATRTAKGTWKAKASGTTLTGSDVSATEGHSLLVAVCYQGTTPPSTVKWGARELSRIGQRIHTTPAFGVGIYHARRIRNTGTRDLVATWSSSLGARVMLAATLDVPHIRDEVERNLQTASTAPTVGPTAELDRSDSYAFGVLVSEGPSSDTAPTLAAGWTAGQRDGTVGVPPVSNLTMLEGYQQLTSSPGVTLSGTGATARDWCNVLVGLRPTVELCTDVNGSEVAAGDTVVYSGSSYTVDAVYPRRNVLGLATVGNVGAYLCEVRN